MIKNLTDIVTLLLLVAPITLQLAKNIAQHTHSKKMQNLVDRASIIVNALDRNDQLTNEAKKKAALVSLAGYASEVGIKVSSDQLSQYIENAVALIRTADQALTASDTLKFVTPIQETQPQTTVIPKEAPDVLNKEYQATTVGGDSNASKEDK